MIICPGCGFRGEPSRKITETEKTASCPKCNLVVMTSKISKTFRPNILVIFNLGTHMCSKPVGLAEKGRIYVDFAYAHFEMQNQESFFLEAGQ